jgi:hypothetical protein
MGQATKGLTIDKGKGVKGGILRPLKVIVN